MAVLFVHSLLQHLMTVHQYQYLFTKDATIRSGRNSERLKWSPSLLYLCETYRQCEKWQQTPAIARPSASPAGGQGRLCPPDFRFCPPDFFVAPPRYFFGRKKLVFLGGKNVKICDFGQKKNFFFGDHLLLVGKSVISARKSLRISAKTFFFWRSPAFGRKICDFGQKKPSDFGENLCTPDFNFAPPPDLAKLATSLSKA